MKLFYTVDVVSGLPRETITPHARKRWLRGICELYAEAREAVAKARADKAQYSASYYEENLEGYLHTVNTCRSLVRQIRAALRACKVEKYSNLSPSAAAREARRRGSY